MSRFFLRNGGSGHFFIENSEKHLAFLFFVLYSLGMSNPDTYKGFTFEREGRIVTFSHPNEDGSGNWSGWAMSIEDAILAIDEMID